MIAFELMFVMVLGVVAIVTIAAVGRPLAEAYAEKLKAQHRQLESHEKLALTNRILLLEQEVVDLKSKMAQIQETTDFTTKYIERFQFMMPQIEEKKES